MVEKFGEQTWEELRSANSLTECDGTNSVLSSSFVLYLVSYFLRLLADVQDTFMTYEIYDDVITLRLVQEACKMLGEPHKQLLVVLLITWP